MDGITVADLIGLAKNFGFPGLVLLLWFFTYRDQNKVLQQYQKDMAEQRQMYENNVQLVKSALKLSEDQQEVIIMNTRAMTKLVDRIDSNQFCPMVRLKKIEGTPE